MPGATVDKEAVLLGLFREPSENLVFLDGEVVAVVHDVLVEVFLVVECPGGKEGAGHEGYQQGCHCVLLGILSAHRGDGLLDKVCYGEGSYKRHGREHHQAVTLVNLDAEIARDIFKDHVGLNMVQEQEGENFQIEVVLFRCAENGSCK